MDEIQPVATISEFVEAGNDAQLAALYGALSAARGEFTKIVKGRTVTIRSEKGTYTFDYAELEQSLDATIPALAKHGLVVMQPFSMIGNIGVVRTIVAHKDGGRIKSLTEVPEAKDIKGLGGNITYLRRYAFNAMLCLSADADADDMPEQKRGEVGAQSGPRRSPEVSAAKPAEPARAAPRSEPPPAKAEAAPITETQRARLKELFTQLGAANTMAVSALCNELIQVPSSGINGENANTLIAKLGQKLIDKAEGK